MCKYVVEQRSTIAINDARQIPELQSHPAIVENGVVAYLGAPLFFNGQVLGSVCVVDTNPRKWSERDMVQIERRANFVRSELECGQKIVRKFGT